MGYDEEFDDELEFDEDEEEGLDEELEDEDEDDDDMDENEIDSKTPATRITTEGKKISVFFISTIGPEKKQKLLINTGNLVGDIKQTVANLFALDPADFYLSALGITMDEHSPLKAYEVDDGDDILLIPASIAG
ncbi:MAG: hypothetical protein ACW99E_23485 [Promethearchaeota archaeon]|jgi:hypothetical protein